MTFEVQAARPEDFAWIEARTGCVLTRNATGIKATDATGRIAGMVAYDGWTENAANGHWAFDTPIALRRLLRPGLSYPFVNLDKQLLLGTVRASNTKSLLLAAHLGFREVRRLPDGWAKGESLVYLELRREACRWLSHRKAA